MKRVFFLKVLIPFLFCLCSNSKAQDLTDEHLLSLTTLDYELWLEFISKDSFIPGFFPGVVGVFPDYRRSVGAVKDSFTSRERQTIEAIQTKITPLSSELAFMTHTGLYENWFKTGEYRKDFCNATVLWKKEKDVWKIIHTTEAWIPKND